MAAAHGTRGSILIAGVSGLVAGAMAMAAGEYVSVHSQADTEGADLAKERIELRTDLVGERAELASIYVGRGLDPALAEKVALQLMAHDALGAHARDELGLTEELRARPVQAALTSAASFSAGALVPLLVAAFTPDIGLMPAVAATSLLFLALLGAAAARVGARGSFPQPFVSPFGAFWQWLSPPVSALSSARWFEHRWVGSFGTTRAGVCNRTATLPPTLPGAQKARNP